MKTQINDLVSGARRQVLNSEKDYSIYPKSTSHVGHAGSNSDTVLERTAKIIEENPDMLTISLFDHEITLQAQRSLSGKTVTYYSPLPIEIAERYFDIPKKGIPSIQFFDATHVEISNGKNVSLTVCPSLITIL